MPTPRTMDDITITPVAPGGVPILAYLEARIRDQKEAAAIEVQALREMLLRFRDDAAHARAEQSIIFDHKLTEWDLRYQQRYEASQQALAAAMLAAEKAIQSALMSQKEAVGKAEAANEKRFEGVNEFRRTLAEQTSSFIPRVEANGRFDSISEKLASLSSRLDRSEGTGKGISATWAILVSVIGIVGTISAIAMALINLK